MIVRDGFREENFYWGSILVCGCVEEVAYAVGHAKGEKE